MDILAFANKLEPSGLVCDGLYLIAFTDEKSELDS